MCRYNRNLLEFFQHFVNVSSGLNGFIKIIGNNNNSEIRNVFREFFQFILFKTNVKYSQYTGLIHFIINN